MNSLPLPGIMPWVLSSICLILAWIFLAMLYRVALHPLAKYPGPLLAKFSDIYMFYYAYRGDAHVNNLKLHEKYGTFVRIGPNRMSINSNTAIKQIYGPKANVQKSYGYNAFPANPNAPSTHTAIDRNVHARKRRTLAHGFSDAALKELEPHIQLCTSTLNEKLYMVPATENKTSGDSVPWSEPYDMASWAGNLAFDVISQLIFSKSYGMLSNPSVRWIQTAIQDSGGHKYIFSFLPLIQSLGLDRYLLPNLTRVRERLKAFSINQLKERMADGERDGRKDFIGLFMQARDSETGDGFTKAELGSESVTLIAAGSDTTSTALAATFFYLTHDSFCLSKATSEIRATFNTISDIAPGPKLASCVFSRACIEEAMRLAPPVPSILPREVLPGGVSIDEHYFNPGTDIGVPPYAVMRNPAYYTEPHTYNPSRWIESEEVTKQSIMLAQSAFCPFSIGPRGCIAKNLAYVELTVALAKVLWEYDIKREEGSTLGDDGEGNYEIEDCFVAKKGGPMVQFRPRQVV